jgi:hypothetical protein
MFRMFSLLTRLAALTLLLGGCAATSMQGSWADPDYRDGPVRSVFIVGTAKDDLVRRVFEDALARQLAGRGVSGIPSYRHLGAERLEDRAAMQAKLDQLGAETVLVSRVTGRRTDTVVNPARTSYRALPDRYPDHYRDHWYDYYRRSYEVLHTPATLTNYEVVTVESSLYAGDGGLIWTAQTETITGGEINTLVEEFVQLLIDDLVKQGLL